MRYAMVIDQKRCIGCHACAVGCKSENKIPDGQFINRVETENSHFLDVPAGEPLTGKCTLDDFNRISGKARMNYMTKSCQHCDDAPCVKVCPTGCTWQREDGIVEMDTTNCIGCDSCMTACPFGYREMRIKISNPAYSVEEIGDQEIYPTLDNTVKKCTFCSHRLKRGESPFCVEICPARARYFGDITNSASEVYRLVNSDRQVKQYPAQEGHDKPENTYVFFIDRVEKK